MKLLWCDLETSGLDSKTNCILEASFALADINSPQEIMRQSHVVFAFGEIEREWLRTNNPKVFDMHTKNGLLEECSRSTMLPGLFEVVVLEYVPWIDDPDERVTIAGSSVHFDLSFLREWMPTLASRLSHRTYDVSAIKLFFEGQGMPRIKKRLTHRTLDDIFESMYHLRQCELWGKGYR